MQIHNVAKSVILNAEDQVLVLVRSADDDYAPGRVDLPGGLVEDGEDFAVGASREVEEETGIKIAPSEFNLLYAGTEIGQEEAFNKLAFMAHAGITTVTLSSEHTSYEWLDLKDAIEKFHNTVYGEALGLILTNQLHKI